MSDFDFLDYIPREYKDFPLAYNKAIKKIFNSENNDKLVVNLRDELKLDLEKHIHNFILKSHFVLETVRAKLIDEHIKECIIEETKNINTEKDLRLFLAGMIACTTSARNLPSIDDLLKLVGWEHIFAEVER